MDGNLFPAIFRVIVWGEFSYLMSFESFFFCVEASCGSSRHDGLMGTNWPKHPTILGATSQNLQTSLGYSNLIIDLLHLPIIFPGASLSSLPVVNLDSIARISNL